MRSPELFVGRARVWKDTAEFLSVGQSVLLIGGRRAGKTTLARRLDGSAVGRSVVGTDVSGWQMDSEATALGSLLGSILGGTETDHQAASRREVVESLEARAPLALVIDQADRLLQTSWGPGFLAFLRHLDDTRMRTSISFLLLGGPILILFRDPDDRGSPPLNTSEIVFLDPLPVDAVTELAAMVDPGRAELSSWALRFGGGQPWLTTRLLGEVWRGLSTDDALTAVRDRSIPLFETWYRQLGVDGRSLARAIPVSGIPLSAFGHTPWGRYVGTQVMARAVGAARPEGGRLLRGPEIFLDWLTGSQSDNLIWDIAISYATPDESIARAIARQLEDEFAVFFAPDQSGILWGEDLNALLPRTYGVQSKHVLVMCTPEYVNRHWTLVEYQAVVQANPNRILLVEMGATPPNLPAGVVYRGSSDAELVGLISALRVRLRQ